MRIGIGLAAALLALLPGGAPAARGGDGEDWRRAVQEVQRAAGEKDPGPLADALYALRAFDGEPAARLLLSSAFRREVPDFVLDAACDALAAFRTPEAAAVFVKECEGAPSARKPALLEALGRLQDPSAEAALAAAAGDPDPRIRTAALRALADRGTPGVAARGAAGRACSDPAFPVRSAAINALGGWKALPGAVPLLGRVPLEKGRLYGDLWRALRRISGEDLAPSPKAFADWWRTQPGEDGWTYGEEPAPPAPSLRGPGILSYTRRVVFVLDTSDGMADRPGYRGVDLAPADVREDPAVFAEWKAIESRLDHARCHLARMIRMLPADAAFDVVFGGESAGAVFRGCEPATAANRDRALGRLRGLNAKQRQDFFRLVKAAWAGSPDGDPLSPEAFERGADTVVYLGTALPSYGAETDPGRIAATVRRWNRLRQVRFFGIGVGNHGGGLLSDLASTSPYGEVAAIP